MTFDRFDMDMISELIKCNVFSVELIMKTHRNFISVNISAVFSILYWLQKNTVCNKVFRLRMVFYKLFSNKKFELILEILVGTNK